MSSIHRWWLFHVTIPFGALKLYWDDREEMKSDTGKAAAISADSSASSSAGNRVRDSRGAGVGADR